MREENGKDGEGEGEEASMMGECMEREGNYRGKMQIIGEGILCERGRVIKGKGWKRKNACIVT